MAGRRGPNAESGPRPVPARVSGGAGAGGSQLPSGRALVAVRSRGRGRRLVDDDVSRLSALVAPVEAGSGDGWRFVTSLGTVVNDAGRAAEEGLRRASWIG